ncbi:MAG: Rieske 2Fe-2S domain-containing protein [Planctomycetes bacterium]|nr:Rieske 2Fe-2S domain-containing protein [Planctomycetota bacterium]
MTATADTLKEASPGVPAWHNAWFPIAFSVDATPGRLHRVTVFDNGYVFFRDEAGAIRVLEDRCPHRLARLSDGRLVGSEIECLYHGWRFAADGECVRIPQLDPSQPIPKAACARRVPVAERQGMIWIHCGEPTAADPAQIPTIDDLDRGDCHSIDFAIDLPYGQEFLVENVLDYAHIHIAHDGVRGGGHAALAGPLAFELAEAGPAGFSAHFGRAADGRIETGSLDAARVAFVAPNLVHYWSVYGGSAGAARIAGLGLYSLPLGQGRCRLLYRAYSNFTPWRDRVRPRFWEHGFQCHLLEQDMAVVTGQAANIARLREPLGKSWVPLKTSDALVLAYRKWLDDHAEGRPDYIGLRTRGDESHREPPIASLDRFGGHVLQCASCRRALQIARRLRVGGFAAGLALLAVAACVPAAWNVLFAGLAALAFLVGLAALGICRRLGGSASATSAPLVAT